MNAVARLLITCFTGHSLFRVCTIVALIAIAVCVGEFYFFPELLFGPGSTGVRAAFLWIPPIIGIFASFSSGSVMAGILWHYACSRHIYVLPYARLKFLCGALCTVILVALSMAVIVTGMFSATQLDLREVFWKTVVLTSLSSTTMYVVVLIANASRNGFVQLCGTMIVIVGMGLPSAFIVRPSMSMRWPLIACVAVWTLLIVAMLNLSRTKAAAAFIVAHADSIANRFRRTGGGQPGREVDLLVGGTYQWPLAIGLIVPTLIASQLVGPQATLCCLAIFGALSGAATGRVPAHSRSLWLRLSWSRAELFDRMETLFWRRNRYALAVLSLLLVGLGSYLGLSIALMALGVLLIVLASAASMYLGLMMTKNLGWVDSLLVIGTMLLVSAVVIYAALKQVDVVRLAVPEALLAAATLAFRLEAKRRWNRIDWMLCRPIRVA